MLTYIKKGMEKGTFCTGWEKGVGNVGGLFKAKERGYRVKSGTEVQDEAKWGNENIPWEIKEVYRDKYENEIGKPSSSLELFFPANPASYNNPFFPFGYFYFFFFGIIPPKKYHLY